jgi:hypothetical protein
VPVFKLGDFVTENENCALPKLAADEFRVTTGEVSGLWYICNARYENIDYPQTLLISPVILLTGSMKSVWNATC